MNEGKRMKDFPQWGFWTKSDSVYGSINVTIKVHYFLSETKNACGYSPIIPKYQSFMRWKFSNKPYIGFYEVAFGMEFGRSSTVADFKKCKKCLKSKVKSE